MNAAKNIDQYIESFPADIQIILNQLRATIKNAAPEAQEAIRYAMPTFQLHGNLVHFAAYKNHIGFYPAPSGIEAYRNDLKHYKTSKGAIQFPIDQALPLELIKKITEYRVKENVEKAQQKKSLKKG